MKIVKKFKHIALSTLVLTVASLAQPARPNPDTSGLTREEKLVLEYLKRDWRKEYRTTSIGLAARIAKIDLPDASRLRLAKFIEANRMAYVAPARHRTTTVALTREEKLLARGMLLVEARQKAAASKEDVARAMGVAAGSLDSPLRFLRNFGVLPAGSGYRVDAKYPRRPSRFIDFFSHQVEVNGRDKFEVA